MKPKTFAELEKLHDKLFKEFAVLGERLGNSLALCGRAGFGIVGHVTTLRIGVENSGQSHGIILAISVFAQAQGARETVTQSSLTNSARDFTQGGRPGGVIGLFLDSLAASSRLSFRRKARISSLSVIP